MALGAGGLWAMTGCQRATSPTVSSGARHVVERTGYALGTEIRFTVLHEDRRVGESAVDAAMNELRTVESVMSLYRTDSQIVRLNRDGELADPHPMLVEVLNKSAEVSRRSDGAFDVTVQSLWQVCAAAQKQGRLPTDAELDAACALVDWQKVEVSPQRIRLLEPGMAITLNGIAQGYAADRVKRVLTELGVEHALVNTGEIGTIGPKMEQQPWRVAVQDPGTADGAVAVAELTGRCMATSGDYATRFDEDGKLHHIFDPDTGRSPQTFSSVSVIASSATDADAYSTAIFVMGPEKAMALIQQVGDMEALFVLKDGTVRATRGWPLAS